MQQELKDRTKQIALVTWRNCQELGSEFYDYKRQLIRCSSSVGANYRAACRAKSDRDFINKLKIVEEELDETMFFIELIVELKPDSKDLWRSHYEECLEVLKIIVTTLKTSRGKLKK